MRDIGGICLFLGGCIAARAQKERCYENRQVNFSHELVFFIIITKVCNACRKGHTSVKTL